MRLAEGKKIVGGKRPLFSADGKVYDATGKKHDLLPSRYPEQPLMDRLPHLKRAKAKGCQYFYFKEDEVVRTPLPHINSKEFIWEYQVKLAEKFGRQRPVIRQKERGYVYFIGAEIGPIKIGHSQQPETRMASMQCGSPLELMLLAKFPGGQPLESKLHKKLREYRVRGEWFERCDAVLAEMERLKRKADNDRAD